MNEIRKILVANRGEIAVRVMRTCHDMGIGTVAVYSDADVDSPHVRYADEAVRIGPAPSTQSYLVIERVLEAARLTGADAVHPGYGFLAENAAFAEACAEAGVIFIGPSPEVIRAMGSKREARRRVAAEAGVPVVPGYDGAEQDDEHLAAEARKLGFPVLIKASAGGGGKGMQVVHDDDPLLEAIESARRVAQSAFGDGTLLIERYVERPRHVEIQILGDQHGQVVHLFERECSIQRRHQKIIEETPSTALDDALRQKMGDAAVAVGRVLGYQNAGTVEFILAPDGAFYFLEVNTRLQVEHPVTEAVTGVDLVREQILIARGAPLSFQQGDLTARGAAIECRLYAEDPANNFLPSTGRIVDWQTSGERGGERGGEPIPGLRVDSGIEAGSVVDVHYDPMLAKIITHGRDRDEALARMQRALTHMSVQGVVTNRDLLLAVLGHRAFAEGDTDTHFIETHLQGELASGLRAPRLSDEAGRDLLLAAVLADHERRRLADPGPLPDLPTGYRNNPYAAQTVTLEVASEAAARADYTNLGGGRFLGVVHVESESAESEALVEPAPVDVLVLAFDDPVVVLEIDGHRQSFRAVRDGDVHWVQGLGGSLKLRERPRFPEPRAARHAGSHSSPMPGTVIAVSVEEGQAVTQGQVLVILEAMKMEQSVRASEDGVVARVLVEPGEQVEPNQPLVILEG